MRPSIKADSHSSFNQGSFKVHSWPIWVHSRFIQAFLAHLGSFKVHFCPIQAHSGSFKVHSCPIQAHSGSFMVDSCTFVWTSPFHLHSCLHIEGRFFHGWIHEFSKSLNWASILAHLGSIWIPFESHLRPIESNSEPFWSHLKPRTLAHFPNPRGASGRDFS